MENKAKAAIIVSVITRELELASSKYINSCADLARAETGDKLWKKHEEEQGYMGFSQAPYNVDSARARVKMDLEEKLARKEVFFYAIEVFLSKIPNDKSDTEKKVDTLVAERDNWKREAKQSHKTHLEWCDEHREVIEFILGVEYDNLDEAMHCLYQEYLSK